MSSKEMQNILVYLTEHLTNLNGILLHLEQQGIFSRDECEEVKNEKIASEKNYKLLTTIEKKDWNLVRIGFLETLRRTNNEHCANKIEEIPLKTCKPFSVSKILKNKWWPDKKRLIKSLHKRKIGSNLLVEELEDQISKDDNRMVVICESADASKYSGMGGVGKTLTAKWYAHHYEKNYDHILWIDCGEGSLLNSFQKLAKELKVEDLDRLTEVEEFAKETYEVLSQFKCLWIYDNAESYQGKEGIIEVLPKYKENFFCLITSRSKEWGYENGYGKISHFELPIFENNESLEFLKQNLKTEVNYTEHELKELCLLLGNLPLALQLAVATLNCGKINLQNYIEKTSSKDLEKIVDSEFDDYEKTISGNVKISLDLILKEKNGKCAYEMLMIFGYIRPDDVHPKFLMKILNWELDALEAVIDLLEEYSLISKTGKVFEFPKDGIINRIFGKQVEMNLLSIHRLLQQVIRHNGRKTERNTLRNILSCKGYVDNKLIPFTKYADKKLQNQFPRVKAELLDQQQLKKLIREERFEECVQLAKFIHEELKTKITKFNYAICLDKNGQTEECVKTLEKLYTKRKTTINNSILNSLEILLEGLDKNELRKITFEEDRKLLDLKSDKTEMEIADFLFYSYLRLGKTEEALMVGKQAATLYQLFRIIFDTQMIIPNYHLTVNEDEIHLKLDGETKRIELRNCSLSWFSFDRIRSEELILEGVSFTQNGQQLKEVTVNKFVDLSKINRLSLNCYEKKNLSIDFTEDVSIEYLELNNVKVLDNWNVQKIRLWDPFVTMTKMKIKEMYIGESYFDISCLPQTIEKLTFHGTEVVCSEGIELPNFKYLTLKRMKDISSLTHFRSSQLTHIHFDWIKEVNVSLMPESVTELKITGNIRIVGGVRKLDKIILEVLFGQVKEHLSHFQTDNLVIHYKYGVSSKELIELMEKEIKTMSVGRMKWIQDEDCEIFSRQVAKKADYYLWEGGKLRGMEWEEFEEFLKLS